MICNAKHCSEHTHDSFGRALAEFDVWDSNPEDAKQNARADRMADRI